MGTSFEVASYTLPGPPASIRIGNSVEVWIAGQKDCINGAAFGGVWMLHLINGQTDWLAFSSPVTVVACADDRCCTLGIRGASFIAVLTDTSKKTLVDRLINLDRSTLAGRLSALNGWVCLSYVCECEYLYIARMC